VQVPAPFQYERASSVHEALALLAELGEGARILAGGHSLLPMMKLRIAAPECVIDIDGLAGELGYIRVEGDTVRIGDHLLGIGEDGRVPRSTRRW
jgi:carbon-monoxide dehydrogenase medium subunit